MSGGEVDWVAVDWGTSHVRVWLMNEAGPVRQLTSDQGMSRLAPDAFEPTLRALIDPHLTRRDGPVEVVICGMAGARQGWAEAPYVPVPCEIPRKGVHVPTGDPRLHVRILPGLSQARPADVMRGEETQIGGFLAQEPDFDGVLCLPGTHTKWAHISAREVVSFRTFMTGELFALLSETSVLRHSTGPGWDHETFAEAVGDSISRPAGLAAALFGVRASALLDETPPGECRARLSGLLVGAELAAARPYWLGQEIVLLGEETLAQVYLDALATQGAPARQANATEATLAGLTAARRFDHPS